MIFVLRLQSLKNAEPERRRPYAATGKSEACDWRPRPLSPILILDKVAAPLDDVAFDLAYLLEQLGLVFGFPLDRVWHAPSARVHSYSPGPGPSNSAH
jgi:hypothetical protein